MVTTLGRADWLIAAFGRANGLVPALGQADWLVAALGLANWLVTALGQADEFKIRLFSKAGGRRCGEKWRLVDKGRS